MRVFLLTAAAISLFLNGCAKNVQAWEKESLAKETMKTNAGNNLLTKYQEHIYFSNEASKGGSGVGGGGCGCN